jgi:hypothetical protein
MLLNTNRVGKVCENKHDEAPSLRFPCPQGNFKELIRVHRFGTESLSQGRFSPRGRERVGAPFCPHPLCPPLPRGGRGGLWSAEAKLPPTLKLTLQHSKQVSARLPSPTLWERGWG